ncbi:hypothetical protein BCR34DRAFT_476625 [Clohesyomyces aquaticus]|uniref:Uncharacterized protein n=1 Tax=Clohesyomyces aquaticus TaxID=1231657 RepID=A0A1Y2A1B6_9PLEO|nr:hypothetical protein BCR34DRAFT_476625 [Clohesyomyces aquaticus]
MVHYNNPTRSAVVVLKALGKPNHEITGVTGVEKRTINSIYARAIERGFDPSLRPLKLEEKHLEDAHRSGQPSKQSKVAQKVVNTPRRIQYLSCYSVTSLKEGRLQENQANEEAWVNEADEGGSI